MIPQPQPTQRHPRPAKGGEKEKPMTKYIVAIYTYDNNTRTRPYNY